MQSRRSTLAAAASIGTATVAGCLQRGYEHLEGYSGSTAPDWSIEGRETRNYTWTAHDREWEWSVAIPDSLVQYYDRRPRMNAMGQYVADPFDDEYVAAIADEFRAAGEQHDLSERALVDTAMAFVQQLRYTPDAVATGFDQYAFYPVQTLLDQGGDCEDTSILMAAILRELGYGAVLLAFWDREHMALGVQGPAEFPGTYYEHDGRRYYYVETTGAGWTVGDQPSEMAGATADIQPIHGHPVLVHRWSIEPGFWSVTVRMDVENVGDEAATGVTAAAIFEAEGEAELARAGAHLDPIPPDTARSVEVRLRPPADQRMRLRTRIGIDGILRDEATSQWLS